MLLTYNVWFKFFLPKQMKDVKILLPSIRFSFCILSLFQKDNTKDIAEPITHLPLPVTLQISLNKSSTLIYGLNDLILILSNVNRCVHTGLFDVYSSRD